MPRTLSSCYDALQVNESSLETRVILSCYDIKYVLLSSRYGDRTPISVVAKLVSICWIIVGLVIVSVFTSMISSSLTVVVTVMEQEAVLYGTNVRICTLV